MSSLGGGSSGAKFVVNFSVEGSGERDLEKIAGLFKGIQASAAGSGSGKGISQGLGQASGHAEELSTSLHKTKGHMEGMGVSAMVGMEAMEKMGEAGVGLIDFGVSVFETWGKAFEHLLHKGGEFESLILRIQGSGKTHGQALDMMDKALEITSQLPITEMDAARIVQTFATIHIDATERMGESYAKLAEKGKTMKGLEDIMSAEKMAKEGPKAVNVVTDMLSAMGHLGTGYQQQAIHEMMVTLETGKIMSKLTFAGLGGDLEKFKKMLHSAKDPAARLVAMQEILSKRGALGLSMAAMSTWGGVMSNFKGLVDRVAFAIDEPGKKGGFLNRITMGMKELYETIADFFDKGTKEGTKFLGMLRETFGMVGGWMVEGVKILGKALKVVFTFMGDHPALVKTAAALTIVGGAVLILGGAFLTASAAIGGVILALVAMPELLLAPFALLPILPVMFVAIAGAIAMATVAYHAWEKDFGGIKTFFSNVKLVIDAVSEALDNWGDGMSATTEETAEALEKAGLAGVFLKIINVMRQVEVFYKGFIEGFGVRWEAASVKFGKAWDRLSSAFGKIMDAGIAIMSTFGMMVSTGRDAVESAGASGESWGDKLGQVAEAVASLAESAAGAIDDLINNAPAVVRWFSGWYQIVLEVISAMKIMAGVAGMAFNGLALVLSEVMAVASPLMDVMWGIAKATMYMASAQPAKAWEALSEGTSKAAKNAEYWQGAVTNRLASEGKYAAMAKEGYDELSEGKGKETADNFNADAQDYLKRARMARRRGEPSGSEQLQSLPEANMSTAPNMSMQPGDIATTLAASRQRAQLPPVHVTVEAKLENEVLFTAVKKMIALDKEQSGGHSSEPNMSGG
jgi:hypothetical protein